MPQSQLLRKSEGFVMAFSIVSRSSFDAIDNFRENIERAKDNADAPMLLAGLKLDLEHREVEHLIHHRCDTDRKVSFEEAVSYANEHNMKYIEASALSGVNVPVSIQD